MMKTNMKYFSILVLMICLLSCAGDDKFVLKDCGTSSYVGDIEVIRSDNSFFNEIKKDTIIADDLGKYLSYSFYTDYIAGISSIRENPLKNEFVYGFSTPLGGNIMTRSGCGDNNTFAVSVNYIDLTTDVTTKTGEEIHFKPLFGDKVHYRISNKSVNTRSELPEPIEIDMYVPELINITFPLVEREEDFYPLCLYNSFMIRWNADIKNENGVLVVVEWHGSMVFGEDNENAYVRCIDLVVDSGETFINPAMFKDIPDTALCTLTILRGNVENILAGDVSYKLVGSTCDSMQFVLIKNVVRNEK